MKTKFFLTAATAACVLFSVDAMAQTEEINLLENATVDGVSEWQAVGVRTNEANNYFHDKVVTYDANESHTADWSGSLKIGGLDCQNGFRPWQAWRHRDIMVEGGATYRISLWVKTVEMPKNAGVYLGFGLKDAAGQWLKGWVPGNPEKNAIDHQRTSLWVDRTKGTHDWVELTAEFTIPEDAVKISYLQARVDGIISAPNAFAWFDDFKIVKVK